MYKSTNHRIEIPDNKEYLGNDQYYKQCYLCYMIVTDQSKEHESVNSLNKPKYEFTLVQYISDNLIQYKKDKYATEDGFDQLSELGFLTLCRKHYPSYLHSRGAPTLVIIYILIYNNNNRYQKVCLYHSLFIIFLLLALKRSFF